MFPSSHVVSAHALLHASSLVLKTPSRAHLAGAVREDYDALHCRVEAMQTDAKVPGAAIMIFPPSQTAGNFTPLMFSPAVVATSRASP